MSTEHQPGEARCLLFIDVMLKQTHMRAHTRTHTHPSPSPPPKEKLSADTTTYAHNFSRSAKCPNDNMKKEKWKAIIKECVLPNGNG